MSCVSNFSDINETFIVEPVGNPSFISACTAFYTNNIVSCSGDTQIFLGTGVITFDGSIYTNNDLTANTINASTYYSGGTNVIDIINNSLVKLTGGTFDDLTDTLSLYNSNGVIINVTGFTDYYTTGSTLIGKTIYFDRNDKLSAYTADLSSFNTEDKFVTGVTFTNNQLIIGRNDGVNLNTFINTFTGLTINGRLNVTDILANSISANTISATTISATTLYGDGSHLTGISTQDTRISGFTYSSNTFTIQDTTGGTFSALFDAVTGLTVNGTLSASTISGGTLYGDGSGLSNVVLSLTATSGLSADSTNGNITIINTAPNQTISITGGTNIEVVSNYPSFGINFTGTTLSLVEYLPLSGGTVTGETIFTAGLTANTISATTYYNLPSTSGEYLPLSGGTVTGATNFTDGLTASTISATTYSNLPKDIFVTGGTYSAGTVTFKNTSGGTFSVSGFSTNTATSFTGGTVSGATVFISGLTANTISATTYQNLPTDIRTTGATYSSNTFTFRDNTGGTYSVLFNTLTGLTVNGSLTVTGNTSLQGLTASTISATTYSNLPNTLYTGNGTLTGNRIVNLSSYTLNFSSSTNQNTLVLSSGNVGIGKSPSYKLDVNGDINFPATTGSAYGIIRQNGGVFLHTYGSTNLFLANNSGNFTMSGTGYNIGIGTSSFLTNISGAFNIGIGFRTLNKNTTGNYNIGIGYTSLQENTTADDNLGIGYQSLQKNTTGTNNLGIGNDSLSANTIGIQNLAIGRQALKNNTTANNNLGIGYNSLRLNTTGIQNIAIGVGSLENNTTANNNLGIGLQTLGSNTTGTTNIAIGSQSLLNNTTGNYNIAVGYTSLFNNTTGDRNLGMGTQSLFANTTGFYNTAVGDNAMNNNTSGNNNTAIGISSMYKNTTGIENVVIGSSALQNNTIGSQNVAIGMYSLLNNNGSGNVAIGYHAGRNNYTSSNKLYIANTEDKTLIYGEFDNNLVGINTISPTNALTVSATTDPLKLEGVQTFTDTEVLTIDGSGVVHKISTSAITSGITNPTSGYIPYNSGGTFLDSVIYNNNGKIGIGTSSPTEILDVNGNGNFVLGQSGYIALWDVYGAPPHTPTYLQAVYGNTFISNNGKYTDGVGWQYNDDNSAASLIQMEPSLGQIIFYTASAGTPGGIINYVESLRMVNGNVGMGTAFPSNKLHVSASTDPVRIEGLTANTADLNLVSIDSSGILHTYPISGLTGSSSTSGAYLPLSGGTVTGSTIFQSGLTSNTISATTYYNLPTDIRVTGGTYTNGTATFTNITGGTFDVSGFSIGGGGGQIFYLNLSQSQNGNRLLSTTASTASEQTSGVTIGSSVTGSIASFQTTPLSISLIPGGIWSFYLHSYKEDSNSSFNIFVEVYKITSGGSQTLLFATDPAPVTTNSPNPSMQLTDGYFSGTSLNVSDGVVAVVKATNTNNQSHSITLVTEGSQHYSYVVSTIPTQQGLTCETLSGCSVIQTINTDISNKFDKSGGTVSGATKFTSGLTANTISATTYSNLPSQSGTGISAFAYVGSTGLLTITKNDTTTLTAGTFNYVTAVTESENVITVTSNGGSPSKYTIDAVTGGTYSNGTITLSGTGSINGNTITGLNTGTITGSGTSGYLSKFTSATAIGDSGFYDNGSGTFGSYGTLVGPSNAFVAVRSLAAVTTNYTGGSIGSYVRVGFNSPYTGNSTGIIEGRSSGGIGSSPLSLNYQGGNVIIGSLTDGGYKLDVNGTTRITNTLTVTASTDPVRFVGITASTDTNLLTIDGTGVIHTLSTSSVGLSWNNATATQSATANNGYVGTATTLTTITLPSAATFGSVVEVVGTGTGFWRLSQNASQSIKFGIVSTTTGTGGYLSATSQYDCVKLLCTSADTTFVVTSSIGNIFYI